ncbi:hypothetical protein [Alteromonas sp. A079]|uniref:hypothetical protein n=1 Tax=Alteromonas sp. A079 TaxID=3410268 RepID=UPI003B9F134E
MLSLVDDINNSITPETHGLYKLSLKPNAQVAIETKPVFGANITLHRQVIEHDSFIAQPDNVIGWLDQGGLSYLTVNIGAGARNGTSSVLLPSQFLSASSGILRVTSPTRVYIIAKSTADIRTHGLLFFTPM